MRYRIGVDIGGTFTDLAALAGDGSGLILQKLPTTPDDPSRGFSDGLEALLADARLVPEAVGYLAHGTTVAINTVLEGKGARTGLITTRGMRDLLELRRQVRDHLYDLQADKPAPLVPRRLRLEVPERVRFDGSVLTPLDPGAVAGALDTLAREEVAALAVCFLHAYANPAHEQAVKALAAARRPAMYLSISSEVLPEFREFERLSTTVLNAYVGPAMSAYLARLAERVAGLGLPVQPHILQSNGGVVTVAHARERPVYTLASGPTAGVAGAVFIAGQAGVDRIVSFDMGGTSTDVGLVERGTPLTATEKHYHGHPVKGSMLDVHSIGAGGGSIAWVDAGGFLRVGPESAGALPGPACYGRGGRRPTVTDANLVLARLGADGLLGGKIRLDPRLAEAAIGEALAGPLGLDVPGAAAAMLTVVDANMAAAIRLCLAAGGHDPRAFTLVAYGGAGPMHATRVARRLKMRRVLVPAYPGVLCALGLLVADIKAEFSRTRVERLDSLDAPALEALYRDLEGQALAWARRGALSEEALRFTRSADMRHPRQNHELVVPVPRRLGPTSLASLARGFHRGHRRSYGYASPEEPVQLVTARVTASLPVPAPRLPAAGGGGATVADAARGQRRVFFEGPGFVPCAVYDRGKLAPGMELRGPAILEQLDCTTVVAPDEVLRVDPFGHLLVDLPAEGA
jgi:N-methylhydantoinase A